MCGIVDGPGQLVNPRWQLSQGLSIGSVELGTREGAEAIRYQTIAITFFCPLALQATALSFSDCGASRLDKVKSVGLFGVIAVIFSVILLVYQVRN